MDPDGARRLNRSSPSCLNSGAQRTDFFHGLLNDPFELAVEFDVSEHRHDGSASISFSLLAWKIHNGPRPR